MNSLVSARTAHDAGESLRRFGTPEAADLARRLGMHTQGELLFDIASRGRYATDASIYQVTPVGVTW